MAAPSWLFWPLTLGRLSFSFGIDPEVHRIRNSIFSRIIGSPNLSFFSMAVLTRYRAAVKHPPLRLQTPFHPTPSLRPRTASAPQRGGAAAARRDPGREVCHMRCIRAAITGWNPRSRAQPFVARWRRLLVGCRTLPFGEWEAAASDQPRCAGKQVPQPAPVCTAAGRLHRHPGRRWAARTARELGRGAAR